MPYRRIRRVLRRRPAAPRLRYRKASRLSRRPRRPVRRSPVLKQRRKWTNPLPQTAFYRLRYIDNGFDGSTDETASYRTFHCFYANSIYDPDVTGVGVQPYGYDQVATLFPNGSYHVVASSITVNFTVNSSVATSVNCYVYPYRTTALPSYNDISDLRNIPYMRYRVTDGISGHTRKNWIKNYVPLSRMFRDRTTRDQAFTSDIAASPSTGLFWHVIFDSSTVSAEVSIFYDVKIVYYVAIARVQDVNES